MLEMFKLKLKYPMMRTHLNCKYFLTTKYVLIVYISEHYGLNSKKYSRRL